MKNGCVIKKDKGDGEMEIRPKGHQLSAPPVEKKYGLIVVKEEPFTTEWVSEIRKEQFYQQYLTPDQYTHYKILSVFVPPYETNEKDFVLTGNMFVFYDESVHSQLLSFVEKRHPSIYNKIRMYEVTDTMFTQSNVYNDEVKNLLTQYLTEQQKELIQEVDRLIIEIVQPFYERVYMLSNDWEKETGITVASEEPFHCYWLDHQKKEAFYDQYLNEKEKELYDVIKSLYGPEFGNSALQQSTDYILEDVAENRLIEFEKKAYHNWISILSEKDPETYKRYRLGVVTGLTDHCQKESYDKEELQDIIAFLQEYIPVLREKTDTFIQMHIKPSYEKWKNR